MLEGSNSSFGVLLSPFSSSLYGGILVLFPSLGNVVGQWVIWVGGTEQSLDGE